MLLRLLARPLPPACLAELFGCFMNVAADVGGDCADKMPLFKRIHKCLAGQLELLKLSFFPAIFAAAPSTGVLDSALEEKSFESANEGGWALEYAGCVRNMLCGALQLKPPLLHLKP